MTFNSAQGSRHKISFVGGKKVGGGRGQNLFINPPNVVIPQVKGGGGQIVVFGKTLLGALIMMVIYKAEKPFCTF